MSFMFSRTEEQCLPKELVHTFRSSATERVASGHLLEMSEFLDFVIVLMNLINREYSIKLNNKNKSKQLSEIFITDLLQAVFG